MSPPAANTRSRNATPNNTPAKARGNGSSSPPTSVVGKKFSALSLLGPSPEVNDEQQTTQTVASTLRMDIFGLLGANPDAHKDNSSRAEFSSMLAEYTSVGEVASSDPIFTIARQHFGLKHEYKLVLIGGASVGKSAWVEKLKSNRFEVKYDTTNKDKVVVRTLVINSNHGLVKIDVWDITGSDPFDGYFVGAHGAIMMYDVKDEKSPMKALTGMYKSLKRVCEGIPLVLVGNKAEWSSRARTKEQQNNARAVATFHRKKGLKHYEISTKNGSNVQKPLLFMLKELTGKRHLKLIGNEPSPSGKKLAEKLQPKASASKPTLSDTSNSSPSASDGMLEPESKVETNKKSAKEAKGELAIVTVAVAAATPLPRVDEEGI